MGTPPSNGKLLYHITYIDNISSILLEGLLSREMLRKYNVNYFTDIADPEIIGKRENYKNALSKYVPFHFYAKNPFDGAVCKKYGSENMVIITVSRDLHYRKDYEKKMFVIPSHPLDKDEPDFYLYEEGLKLVKWDILDNEDERDYHNSEIKKACMAECVIKHRVPPEDFATIYVQNKNIENKIKEMKKSAPIKIQVNPNMFPRS